LVEADETFAVRLTSANGATIATPQATGTIVNDDQPPVASPVSFIKRDDWGAGFVMDVKIKNNSATAMNGWRIEFDLRPTSRTSGTA